MNLSKFLTYCQLRDLMSVNIKAESESSDEIPVYKLSIRTPDDDIALFIAYKIVGGEPALLRGRFYSYSNSSGMSTGIGEAPLITMSEIEEVFFPNETA